jgi:hypothetical protein
MMDGGKATKNTGTNRYPAGRGDGMNVGGTRRNFPLFPHNLHLPCGVSDLVRGHTWVAVNHLKRSDQTGLINC